jgi:RHS repeat-associated protein
VEHNAYAYNRQEQLVVALRQTSSPQAADRTAVQEQLWRYAYDGQQRRVLQQHTQRQDDLQQGTQRLNYVAGSAQLTGTAYDTAGQPTRQGERHYQWDALGRLMQIDVEGQGQTQRQRLAEYRYDHRGLRNRKTTAQEDTHYLYDDSRQLQGEVNAQGRLQRQYVYLADQPLVVIDSTDPGVDLTQAASESVWRQVQDDLQRLWRQWQDRDRLSWLHLNHLGAPEAATNAAGEVIWQLSTGPFGETLQVLAQDGLNVHLRLPGQYWDAESGLHYNRARYYDPAQGAYLSPDPLHDGDTWPDGPNPYAYVAYNPLKYVDPDGLILFAFDGTGNSDRRDDPAMAGNGLSNVVRFRDAYNDGRARYITGVGTVHVDSRYGNIVPDTYAQGKLIDWLTPDTPLFYNDMGGNYSGAARIDRMMLYMRDEADAFDDKEVMDIDIIGFSRGAAQARDFANRITSRTFRQNGKTYYRYQTGTGQTRCQAVNFRFMGLFDTVLSTNFSGYTYRMGIPSAFQYVAQAVALNEYRSDSMAQWTERNPQNYNQHFGGFPLESIGASRNTPGQVRIERGFIGAHADIGGGYADGENQLSLVALNWMVAQAQVAGVKMRQLPRNQQLPTGNPVLHDQSNAMNLGDPRTTQNLGNRPPYTVIRAEDREVRGAVSGRTQRTMGFGAAEAGGNRSMINRDTHQFIAYKPRDVNQLNEGTALDPSTMANRTGTVDMAGYLNWLRQHGYVFPQDY